VKRINQFERTDRDITNALLTVMERKSFEKITVQDILVEALVNRSTFYQHFPDKYAILERLQEKLIGGMTERIDALRRQGAWAQDEINRVFYEYLSAHRRQMELLLSVRSENLDLEKQMRDLFARYLAASGSRLSDLERELLSEIIVRSVVYHIRQGTSMENLSDIMLDTWLNMSVYFYRLERHEDAREQLLSLVKKLHTGKHCQVHFCTLIT